MTDAGLKADVVAPVGSPPAVPLAVAPVDAALPAAMDSFGRALAAARQARGLSQSDIAARLRLQLRQVRALEAEDLNALPQGPFVRGFVRNYARLLDLPAEPLLALLAVRLQPTEPLPIGKGGAAAAPNPVRLAAREQTSRVLVLGGAMAALLLFAVLGWWTMRAERPQPAPAAGAPAGTAAVVVEPASTPTDSSAAPPPAAAAVEEKASAASPLSPTALRFAFRDRSWVEVRQADGAVLLSQNNDEGTSITVDGQPPYSVVIGNASKVDLEFGGRPVDLTAAASRGDVARLRLDRVPQ